MSNQHEMIETLRELDAGIFLRKLNAAAKEIALGTVVNGDKGKKGELTIKIGFARIGETAQVDLTHRLLSSIPTARGKSTEEDTTETPVFVNNDGHMTITPDTQEDFFKTKEQE